MSPGFGQRQPDAITVDDLFRLLADQGRSRYGGEPVSQLEHALQTAALAEADAASPALITAALFHDLGHLVDAAADVPDGAGLEDRRHEALGARRLKGRFGPAVCQPVALHVAAKRWLCATDPGYLAGLSPASVHSLGLQGGPFTAAAASAFLARPFAADAIRLRRWDDLAKVRGALTPGLDHFRRFVDASAAT